LSSYRLAPFAKIIYETNSLVVVSPDNIVELELAASDLIESMDREWLNTDTKDAQELHNLGVVIDKTEMNDHINLLYRLEQYFKEEKLNVRLTHKGASIASAQTTFYGYFADCPEDEAIGFGLDDSKWLAMLKAVAEFYERISCNHVRNTGLITEFSDKILSDSLIKYQDWQIDNPEFVYRSEPSGHWTAARSVVGHRQVVIPLEYQCYPDGISDAKLCSSSSNGVAAHTDLHAALMGSIYELIERDSLMVHWFNMISRELIMIPEVLSHRVSRLNRLGFKVSFVNLTLDLAPVVLVIMSRDGSEFPRHVLGLASAPRAIDAMHKALQEVELSATYYNLNMEFPGNQKEISSVISHQLWYDLPENSDELNFFSLDNHISVESISDGPSNVLGMNAKLLGDEMEWFYTNLNVDGYRKTGLHVVRSIVTNLVPITFGYGCEPLAMCRLTSPPIPSSYPLDKSRMTQEGYRVQPFA